MAIVAARVRVGGVKYMVVDNSESECVMMTGYLR
jgi:hypothetical protein